ncbi:MAG TPA: hypothetical protein VIV60_23170 [Polyangiaceae bacterium]
MFLAGGIAKEVLCLSLWAPGHSHEQRPTDTYLHAAVIGIHVGNAVLVNAGQQNGVITEILHILDVPSGPVPLFGFPVVSLVLFRVSAEAQCKLHSLEPEGSF